ncbi:MAG: AAA family ATPase [Pleomorphochaeta sp.]
MSSRIIITIERDFGADGHEIGLQLSHLLNMTLYDKDILHKAAVKRGIGDSSLVFADEKVTNDNLNSIFPNSIFTKSSDKLFQIEKEIIRDLAESESCIIVGRLSDYILRNKENLIKVYITAPLEFRIKNIQEKYNSSYNDSKKLVRKMDLVRRNYRKYYSNDKYNLYSNKSIVLNRDDFTISECVGILKNVVYLKNNNTYKEV